MCVRTFVQAEQRPATVICAKFLDPQWQRSSDISLLSNTIYACVIFAVETTKLWNPVQKKNSPGMARMSDGEEQGW